MDKPAVRRAILSAISKAAPVPVGMPRLQEAMLLALGARIDTLDLAVECHELETRGYLGANLKHGLDPVYKGITGSGRDQLEMAVKLDPAIWGDAAL
jgi:hypothetical protein